MKLRNMFLALCFQMKAIWFTDYQLTIGTGAEMENSRSLQFFTAFWEQEINKIYGFCNLNLYHLITNRLPVFPQTSSTEAFLFQVIRTVRSVLFISSSFSALCSLHNCTICTLLFIFIFMLYIFLFLPSPYSKDWSYSRTSATSLHFKTK